MTDDCVDDDLISEDACSPASSDKTSTSSTPTGEFTCFKCVQQTSRGFPVPLGTSWYVGRWW